MKKVIYLIMFIATFSSLHAEDYIEDSVDTNNGWYVGVGYFLSGEDVSTYKSEQYNNKLYIDYNIDIFVWL